MRLNTWKRGPVVDNMPSFVKHGGRVQQAEGRMTDSDGNINAYDVKDLAKRISALAQMTSTGEITAGHDEGTELQAKAERHADLKAAFESGDSERMKLHGEVFAEDVWEVMNRQGFTSQLVARKDVVDGTDNRVKLRRKDLVAFQVVNNGEGIAQVVEQAYLYPQDYYLQCHVLIEEREIAQAGPELLDQKFQDALEAIMVRQDRILRSLMLATAGVFNAPISFATFTPAVLSAARTGVASVGNPATNMVFAFDLWDDIIADASFNQWWDPVSKYSLIQEGKLGSILGMNLITDGFRYETLKVLEPGEAFVTATPIALGQRGVRREIQSTEINLYPQGTPTRGMYLMGLESLHIQSQAVQVLSRA